MFESAAHNYKKLSHTIVALYGLTLSVLGIGTAFALHQNWDIRLEATQVNLVRNANIGNILMESTLLNASKVLRSTRSQIELALLKGPMAYEDIQQLLTTSTRTTNAFNKSYDLGLMFYVNAQGKSFGLSDASFTRPFEMSDHFYFTDLRANFNKPSTVGPLQWAHATGQLVFHMSVPVHDAHGDFFGVLVQQILASSLAAELERSTEKDSLESMMISYPGSEASFIYPLPQHTDFSTSFAALRPLSVELNAQFSGHATSKLLGLTSDVYISKARVWQAFLKDNVLLFAYALTGAIFVSTFFFYLYRLAQRLVVAQDSSLHDELTGLNNRRALDEQLPLLLRESMREKQPVTVLFIDIDHFRLFNEHYGHDSGDVALQAVARTLAHVCRRPLDFICRWGGEEFVAVLPNTNAVAAKKLSQDILNAMRALQLHVAHHTPPHLTVSVGHISRTVTSNNLNDDLVDAADQAMLHAKQLGRDRSVMANASDLLRATHMTCKPIFTA